MFTYRWSRYMEIHNLIVRLIIYFCSFSKICWQMTMVHGVPMISRLLHRDPTCFYSIRWAVCLPRVVFSSKPMYAICIYYFNYIKLIIIFIIFYIHEIWVKKRKMFLCQLNWILWKNILKLTCKKKKKKKCRFEVG